MNIASRPFIPLRFRQQGSAPVLPAPVFGATRCPACGGPTDYEDLSYQLQEYRCLDCGSRFVVAMEKRRA